MDIVDNPRSYPNLRFGYEKFCEHDLQRRIINGKSPDQKLLVSLLLMVMNYYYHKTYYESQVLGFHRWGVFCIDQAEINALFNDDEMVQKYGREMSIFYPYEPNINELVLAKVGNVWCRAIYVARTDATKIIVFCVDYGVECSVSTENIRVCMPQI